MYCHPINLDIQPLIHSLDFQKEQYPWIEKIDLNSINPELTFFLQKRKIQITWMELFHKPPLLDPNARIHIDVPGEYDAVKLNWVYGGANSPMKWYKPNNLNATTVEGKTLVNTPYVGFLINDVTLQHQQVLQGPCLVQVGVPHNITMNDNSYRHALSAVLFDIEKGKRLTMARAEEIFVDIII